MPAKIHRAKFTAPPEKGPRRTVNRPPLPAFLSLQRGFSYLYLLMPGHQHFCPRGVPEGSGHFVPALRHHAAGCRFC
jgi:hypothetical protein